MTDAPSTNGWPDPQKPGVPLNPELNGWHWFRFEGTRLFAVEWLSADQKWDGFGRHVQGVIYEGPCPTPSDLAAIRAQERERIAEWLDDLAGHSTEGKLLRSIAWCIRHTHHGGALPDPASDGGN